MRILVDPSSMEATGSRAAVGKICLADGEAFFPDRGWFDFPVVILRWWLEALARLSSGASGREELRFMDGPFRVEIEGGADAASYRLIGPAGAREGVLLLAPFFAQARAAGLRVVDACDTRGWQSTDIDRLRRMTD